MKLLSVSHPSDGNLCGCMSLVSAIDCSIIATPRATLNPDLNSASGLLGKIGLDSRLCSKGDASVARLSSPRMQFVALRGR